MLMPPCNPLPWGDVVLEMSPFVLPRLLGRVVMGW